MSTNIRHYLVIMLATILVACGFHLRGVVDLSFNKIYIKNQNPVIFKELKVALKNNGMKCDYSVLSDPSDRVIRLPLSRHHTGFLTKFVKLEDIKNYFGSQAKNNTEIADKSVQLKKVKLRAKELSQEKLEEMAYKVSSQPGYKEFMTLPLLSSVLKDYKKSTEEKEKKEEKSLYDSLNPHQ